MAPSHPDQTVAHRDELADAVKTVWRAIDAPHAVALRVWGPAGSGKSTFLDVLAREVARRANTFIVQVSCYPLTEGVPFVTVREIYSGLVARVPDAASRYASGLESVLRALELAQNAEPQMVEDAFVQFVRGVLHDGAVVLLIDDFQWLDASSRRVLEFLMRSANAQPLVLICGERTAAEHGALSEIFTAQSYMRPLSPAEANHLIYSIYPGAQPEVVRAIGEHARGNPAVLQALSEQTAADGVNDAAAVMRSLREVIALDVQRADGRLRDFLQTCSLLEEPIEYTILSAIFGDDFLQTWLYRACERYLEQSGPAFAFRHDALRVAIRATILSDVPIQLRIVDALRDRTLRPVQLRRLAGAAESAGNLDLSFDTWIRCARSAIEDHDWDGAAGAYERAFSVRELRGREGLAHQLEYAQVLRLLFRTREAATVLRRAIDDVPPQDRDEDYGGAVAALLNVLWSLDDDNALDAMFAKFANLTNVLSRNDVLAARASLFLFDGYLEKYTQTTGAIDRNHLSEYAQTKTVNDEAIFFALQGRHGAALCSLAAAQANVAMRSGASHYTDTMQLFVTREEFGVEATRARLEQRAGASDFASMEMSLDFAAGQWDAIVERLGRFNFEYCSENERSLYLGYAAALAALCNEAPIDQQYLEREMRDIHVGHARKRAFNAAFWWASASGNKLDPALCELLRTWALTPVPIHDDAIPLSVARFGESTNDADLLRSLGNYDQSVARSPWRRAHEKLRAGWARSALSRTGGAELLRDSAAEFRKLGAPLFAGLAAERAGSLPASERKLLVELRVLSAEYSSGPTLRALTAREREIAKLVSLGLRNREIASRIIISERTVEVHVSNILSKLSFASRNELTRWVLNA